jgi:mRNA interferase HigB
MRIVKWSNLEALAARHAEARAALNEWRAHVRAARWNSPAHLISTAGFAPRAIQNDRVVFKIKGDDYRLICAVKYANPTSGSEGILMVKFFGTHAEYDKIDATTVEL